LLGGEGVRGEVNVVVFATLESEMVQLGCSSAHQSMEHSRMVPGSMTTPGLISLRLRGMWIAAKLTSVVRLRVMVAIEVNFVWPLSCITLKQASGDLGPFIEHALKVALEEELYEQV